MAGNLLEYQCPCCGGKMEFESSIQKMKCPFCDTEFDVETLKHYDEVLSDSTPTKMEWDKSQNNGWQQGETDNMYVYSCNTCSGQIICDKTTAATHCPYCGNPVIMMGQFKGDLRPDCVIPFKLDKDAAIAAFKQHLQGKALLPKAFKDNNHIEEIKGVYVPFWLFNSEADAHINYRATRVKTWSDRRYIYTDTSYYSVVRKGTLAFENIPVDSSSKISNDITESLEPYDLSQAVDFQTAYLSGYLADRYDVTEVKSVERANQRVCKSTETEFAATVTGYASVRTENVNIRLNNAKARYALFPVWLMTTKWNNQIYLFAMNGQTGKFVGNLPMDGGAFLKWMFGIAGAVAAGALTLMWLFWLMGGGF
jgi:DNA-directed RNA polymerase, subunit RPC10 (contains C4-type Zn-finger)